MSVALPYTEAWLQGPLKTQFYTRTYLPQADNAHPKAVIVFIHGFAEHVGRYTHFHPKIAAHGIAVFALDQRGFGLTGQDVEKRSKGSAYGKTGWKDQMGDIAWAVGYAKDAFKGVPVFLMGHSMGGAEVLGFATQDAKSPYKSSVSSVLGVIATSPLIQQTEPASKVLKWIGGKASILAPYTLIAAPVKVEDLSHDKALNDAYLNDPLIKPSGSLKGINDMLTNGEALLASYFKHWPTSLPVLIVHGTADKVTSCKASQEFIDKISASDKKISLFEGGFHELQNEPDGVKEKLVEEVIEFIEARLPPTISVTEAESMDIPPSPIAEPPSSETQAKL
ncbi:alpha/beta-hydrolase [Macrolepiota fuliginosa MF-IS2]|uniref:Alpha/beta-hydrolase n=1 Tax=Macrolepiota fuliginosa MF-IS2 TaxID=1400762 RepID=A0A9P6C2Z5_9AGAR|nr:alpha/beta-hydrolase [Macrolepiota fuliginosa MF-IS2]